jgi:hypothetical protein
MAGAAPEEQSPVTNKSSVGVILDIIEWHFPYLLASLMKSIIINKKKKKSDVIQPLVKFPGDRCFCLKEYIFEKGEVIMQENERRMSNIWVTQS